MINNIRLNIQDLNKLEKSLLKWHMYQARTLSLLFSALKYSLNNPSIAFEFMYILNATACQLYGLLFPSIWMAYHKFYIKIL